MQQPPKIKKVCSTCRSEDVVADAWAAWDFEKQEWVLDQTFENSFCNTCEGECKIEDEEDDA